MKIIGKVHLHFKLPKQVLTFFWYLFNFHNEIITLYGVSKTFRALDFFLPLLHKCNKGMLAFVNCDRSTIAGLFP